MRTKELTVKAGQASTKYWRDLWRYRELLYFLAWRDIKVRYKQTVIGILWAILRPVVTMIVLTVVFGKLAKMPSDGVPYPVLVFAAMLPWQLFANGLVDCSNSLIADADLVTKTYFPRLIIPAGTLLVNLVDFFISISIMVGLMVWYSYIPGWQVLTLPLFLLVVIVVTMGTGLWFAAFNVQFRDFRHIVPFVVQFGLYVSPVGFSSNVIPEQWRMLYSLNPMVGVIDGFRWALLGDAAGFDGQAFLLSACVSILVFISGVFVFRKKERDFADVI